MILPDAGWQDAARRMETLRQGVKHLELEFNNQVLGSITISVGLSACPQHGTITEELVKYADIALHEAKRAGRDQVVVAEAA